MADEKYYEQKLTNITIDCIRAKQDASTFSQISEKRATLVGTITYTISRLIGIGGSEARTYIDLSTGKFEGGKWMPHCLDPELKNLFVQLEAVTKELNKYSFKTATEALNAANTKTEEVGRVIKEVKSAFGEAKAKEIAARAKAAAIKATGINF